MTANRERWKRTERGIAALLDGHRVPVTGRTRGDAPDVAHPDLSIEVKNRESLPKWLEEAFDQAQKSRRGAQVPIVVVHKVGARIDRSIAMVALGDLADLIKKEAA